MLSSKAKEQTIYVTFHEKQMYHECTLVLGLIETSIAHRMDR